MQPHNKVDQPFVDEVRCLGGIIVRSVGIPTFIWAVTGERPVMASVDRSFILLANTIQR
jgi:hypothetical protein